jgi:hypothetical protein
MIVRERRAVRRCTSVSHSDHVTMSHARGSFGSVMPAIGHRPAPVVEEPPRESGLPNALTTNCSASVVRGKAAAVAAAKAA